MCNKKLIGILVPCVVSILNCSLDRDSLLTCVLLGYWVGVAISYKDCFFIKQLNANKILIAGIVRTTFILIFGTFGHSMEVTEIQVWVSFALGLLIGHFWTILFLNDNDDDERRRKKFIKKISEKIRRLIESINWKPNPVGAE